MSGIGAAGKAGPVQFYIGNTNGKASEQNIKDVLSRCADNLDFEGNFDVTDIECLTNGEENPLSKCWRVAVPFDCKELMERTDIFPPEWRHRRFYGSRKEMSDDKRGCVTDMNVEELVMAEQSRQSDMMVRQR
jgi:hypothetical protein